MKHPPHEEWIAFVYGELAPEPQGLLQAHLESCPECRQRVETWRQTMSQLDAWRLPTRVVARPPLRLPLVKWAVAAALFVGLGLAVGRITAPAPDLNRAQARWLPALRQELRKEWTAELAAGLQTARSSLTNEIHRTFARDADGLAADVLDVSNQATERLLADWTQTWLAARDADRQNTTALLEAAERRRVAENAALRHDLETLAVTAQVGLERAQSQIIQLAASPASASIPLSNRP